MRCGWRSERLAAKIRAVIRRGEVRTGVIAVERRKRAADGTRATSISEEEHCWGREVPIVCAITGTWKDGQVVLDSAAEWPDGCRLIVEPMRAEQTFGLRQGNYTEQRAQLLPNWDAKTLVRKAREPSSGCG